MDIQELINDANSKKSEPSFPKRMQALINKGWNPELIERGVAETVRELESGTKSFVIYGEPQSGKTEFMIALCCKLIDMEYQTIFVVMNDNVELETQNFERFHSARELTATPIRDSQLQSMTDEELKAPKQRIIFCRKNKKNLEKVIHHCRFMQKRIIIDDEADYATPNAKINKSEVTAINEKVGELGDLPRVVKDIHVDGDGTYIGVTATPARLDLNNTFLNDSRRWVFLQSHDKYKGRAFFFPVTDDDRKCSNYNLVRLPDEGDDPKWLRHAVFRFLTRVAILNLHDPDRITPYSMLIHTAGKTNDHEKDQKDLQRILTVLNNQGDSKFKKYCEELVKVISELLNMHRSSCTVSEVFTFIINSMGKHEVLVINHKNNSDNVKRAGQPNALFTFAIGGNIVSRGLTFERLLTFYFSRNVKGRLQQNTYIQRARMFGNRPYSEYFELCVPAQLYSDWADCFTDHELSLRLARAGVYQHVQSGRTSVVDAGALDKQNVTMEKAERAVGDIFTLTDDLIKAFTGSGNKKPLTLLRSLIAEGLLTERHVPLALLQYVEEVSNADESDIMIVLQDGNIQNIGRYSDADQETISRPKGGIVHAMLNKRKEYDSNRHFFLPIRNDQGQARILYKSKVGHKILQNLRVNKPVTA